MAGELQLVAPGAYEEIPKARRKLASETTSIAEWAEQLIEEIRGEGITEGELVEELEQGAQEIRRYAGDLRPS